MKLRHKITTTLSVAAALAIVVAVAAFAANSIGIGMPKQDMVFSQPSVVTFLPTPKPTAGQAAVYAHKSGNFYHAQPDCSGMKNAPATSIEQAEADGKKPCPVCLSESSAAPNPSIPPTATYTPLPAEIQRQDHWLDGMLQVYTTGNATYYHAVPDCSGMQNAYLILSKDGDAEGKQPCPNCIPDIGDSSFRRIFGTDIASAFPDYNLSVSRLGTYSDRHGAYLNYFAYMRLDGRDSADFIELQLYPPENGLDGELQISTVGNSGLQGLLDASPEPLGDLTNELIPLYLEKLTGSPDYRHVSAITVSFDEKSLITGCSTVLDIDDETCYLVHWPMGNGLFTLPEIEPTPMPEPYVYCLDSSIYYHSDPACSGMRNPDRMLLREAMQSGRQACPVCMDAASLPPSQATPEPTPPAGATIPPTATLTPIPESMIARATPEPIHNNEQAAMPTAMTAVVDEPRSDMSFGIIGGADGPTSVFITRPEATLTPIPIDYPSPTENITLAPLAEAFSRIFGTNIEEAFPGYLLDYAEGYPSEAGSSEAGYAMWQFCKEDQGLVISLLEANESRDGVLSINFPDSAASFHTMKQAAEPLCTLYMKNAPLLLDGLSALTDSETIQSRYLWDAFIHFNARFEITTIELVYAMADASTAHFSWNTSEPEPRLCNINWIG